MKDIVWLIFNCGVGFGENKSGQTRKNLDLSTLVDRTVLFSNYFLNDLRLLANISL